MMELGTQIIYLFLLAIPVACIAWTVTHEEVFREPRDYCNHHSKNCENIFLQKFFYLFTCEYCFSHYVAFFVLLATGFQILYEGWRGYVIALFSLVWIANLYMTIFGLLRQALKVEKLEGNLKDIELKEEKGNDK